MKILHSLMAHAVLVGTVAFATPALAGDAEAGKAKADTACASCHGELGVAIAPLYPNLAGQYESYLIHALKAYQSGDRSNAVMGGMAAALTAEEIANLAAYYSSLEGTLQTAR